MARLRREVKEAGPERMFYLADAFRAGLSVEDVHALSFVDPWFLDQIEELIACEREVAAAGLEGGVAMAVVGGLLLRVERDGLLGHELAELDRRELAVPTTEEARRVPGTEGDAIKAIQEVAKENLPRGYDIAWEGLSYDEAKRGNEGIYIFLVVLIFVYLVLAAQYESFVLPLVVILSLPVGVLGSFLLLKVMGLANDVYAQIGIIMLIGLLGKNAVLIVEFAAQKHAQGATVLEAAARNGFELGATVMPGGNAFYAQPLMLRRTMIFGDMTLETFKAKLTVSRPLSSP